MGLRIIYGRAGTGKSQYCFSEISKRMKEEKKIYMITPEQFSYTAEKKLMETIPHSAVFNVEVITLSRMAYRVLEEVGQRIENLTECGRAMLIYHILNKKKKEFKFLSKSDENVELAMNAITEFKKHGITVEALQAECEKVEDLYLQTKLKDMILLYKSFENQIANEYLDESDLLSLLSQNLEETDFIKESVIYIDEFSGFTDPEYQVLKKLIVLAKQVNLCICIDAMEPSYLPDTDIFYSNKITLAKLMQFVKEENLSLEEPIFLADPFRFKKEELTFLEKNLYATFSTKYTKNVEKIHLFLAQTPYTEVEQVAKQIVKLVRQEKIRYRDIAVITRNVDTYASLVRAIFEQYSIPVFIDEKRDLNQNILIQYLLSILEVLSQNFSRESIFQYLKAGFFPIEQDDLYQLENYCTKWGINHYKWKKDFTYERQEESKKQKVAYFNELRRQIVEPFLELKEQDKTVESLTRALYEFMQKQQIEEKLKDKISALKAKGFLDLAKEYENSYQIVLALLDELILVFGQEKVTLEQYKQIFKVGLKNSGLGKIPGTQDQVILGDVERSRSHKVDTIFILGLNDGSFPSINRKEGFLGDQDREILKQDGLALAKGTIENLYEENFNIYRAFTTAENKLYLSYASSDSDGKSLRPSMFVYKMKKLYPYLKEESDLMGHSLEITNEKATYSSLLEAIARKEKGEAIDSIWEDVYQYYAQKKEWKEKLERDLLGLQYTNIPNDIDQKMIQKLYGNTLVTSVSKLEKYRSCPFSYYLQYGLKLREKEELKIQSFDTGTFMHEVIDQFFEKVKLDQIPLPNLIEDETKVKQMVEEIVEEELENTTHYRFTATAKYKVLVKRLKKMIAKALKYIVESLVYSDFSIQGTEVEFGKKGEYAPIEIPLENGKRIQIIGKIDRIDLAKTEDGNYIRIIDYKSSAKNIDLNEVYAGIQIQLLTYMDAVCKEKDLQSAGVFYFSLLEQMVKADKKITEEEIEEQIRKNFKMKGLILADVKVIQMQDKNLTSGVSKIVPAGITTNGEVNQNRTNGVTKEEFGILQRYIYQTIRQIGKEILSGKIEVKPYYKKGKTPCEYCPYHIICSFHKNEANNCYSYLKNQSKDDILLQMQKEMKNQKEKYE